MVKVYTGDVNNDVHKVPGEDGTATHEPEKWTDIEKPAEDIKPHPVTGLCPDGSAPNADGVCPQHGKTPVVPTPTKTP